MNLKALEIKTILIFFTCITILNQEWKGLENTEIFFIFYFTCENDVLSPFPALTATHRPLLPPDRAQYVHIWNTVSLSGLSYWKFQNKVDPGRALAAP